MVEMDEKKLVKPYSHETEKAALGSMFMDNIAAVQGCGTLVDEDFYYPQNKLLFHALCSVIHDGGVSDISLVWRQLEKDGSSQQTSISYLSEVAMTVGTSVNLQRYTEELKQLSYYRRCIDSGRKLVEAAYKQDDNGISQYLEMLRKDDIGIDAPMNAADILIEYIEELDRKRKSGQLFNGLQTGFIDFDLTTGGLREDDLYIIAGRPAMGKTAFGLDIARGCRKTLIQEGKAIVIFSLEMGRRDIAARIYCGETSADNVVFSQRENDDEKWAEFLRQLERNGDFMEHVLRGIHVEDQPFVTPENMRAKCHAVRSMGKEIGLIMIDYIQLMHGGKGENRTQDLSYITRSLKLLAKEFHCPVVALSQINRAVEQRPEKRPVLSDLRESGSIEQDADVVMFVYRDEYYYSDTPDKNCAEIIFAKNRKGPVGTVKLAWIPTATTFRNLLKQDTEGWQKTNKKTPWEG